MSVIQANADFISISTQPDFVQAVLRKYSSEKITLPFEDIGHFQFDELSNPHQV